MHTSAFASLQHREGKETHRAAPGSCSYERMFKYPKPGSKRNNPVNVLQGWNIREAVHRAQHCSGMSSTISSERLRAMTQKTQKSHFILLAILPSNSATPPWLKLKHHCYPGCQHSQRNHRLKGWRQGVKPKMNLEQQGQHSPTKF